MLHVVAGVLTDAQGRVLIQQRHAAAEHGGLWEFPGGKLEVGEQPLDALVRELQEELGIAVTQASPLVEISHDYPNCSIFLDTWRVDSYQGEVEPQDGQPIRWVAVDQLSQQPLSAADLAVVEHLLALDPA